MTLDERNFQTGKASVTNGAVTQTILLPDSYPTLIQKYTSCRWCLEYMLIVGFTLVLILRNSMSFAIVCMEEEAGHTSGDNSNFSTGNTSGLYKIHTGDVSFSSEEQGLLISSASYASLISPLVSSYCSKRFGPKRSIFVSMTTGAVLTLVTPVCIRTHLYLAIACRALLGFAVNTIIPAAVETWLYWAPQQEKVQLVSYSFIGYSLALVFQYTLSGFLCLIPVDHGWPFIFYVFGGCTAMWCGLWYLTVHEEPENHPRITEQEKMYIMLNRVTTTVKPKTIPWKSMASSKPVWAFFIVMFCHDWNNGVMFGYLPLYMATVLKFDLTENGLLSSLPYISRTLAAPWWNFLSARLSRTLSVTHTRKVIMASGFIVSAALAVSLCFVEEGQEYVAVAIFIISTPFHVVTMSSVIVTPVDMAPHYASIITSVGMTFSFTALAVAPLFVSFVIPERTPEQWSIVFYTNAGLFVFAIGVFLIFGSGEIQPWAAPIDEPPVEISKENLVSKVDPVDKPALDMSKENSAYKVDVDEITHM